MKARIKKTGEIIDVIKNKHGVYIDREHRGWSAESLEFIEEEIIAEHAYFIGQQDTIEKACQWLKDCLDNGAWISNDVGQHEKNAIIEHFKTYMEE